MKKIKLLSGFIYLVLLKAQTAYAVELANPASGFLISYPDNSFGGLITKLIQILLGIVGVIAVTFVIIGGFQILTARGDEERATAGKKTVTNAIIGLVIVIFSYVMIAVVINALKPGGRV